MSWNTTMNKNVKEDVVKKLHEKLHRASGIVFANFSGMSVAQSTELRRKCRAAKVELQVTKNKLAKLALADSSFKDQIESVLRQPTALAFGYDDPITPVKVLTDFTKITDKLQIKSAVIEGHVYGPNVIKDLARVPSRNVLIAQVLGCLQGPLGNLVGVCQGLVQELVGVVDAIRDKKEKE